MYVPKQINPDIFFYKNHLLACYALRSPSTPKCTSDLWLTTENCLPHWMEPFLRQMASQLRSRFEWIVEVALIRFLPISLDQPLSNSKPNKIPVQI